MHEDLGSILALEKENRYEDLGAWLGFCDNDLEQC
jgi:hypothetical protein